jgi:hypothetical protein
VVTDPRLSFIGGRGDEIDHPLDVLGHKLMTG